MGLLDFLSSLIRSKPKKEELTREELADFGERESDLNRQFSYEKITRYEVEIARVERKGCDVSAQRSFIESYKERYGVKKR